MTDMIGLVAAALTTLSFLPQALMVIRTGRTDGISLIMYTMFTAGVTGWVVYGFLLNSMPIIIANLVTILLASVILGLKVRHTLQARAQAATLETSAPSAS